MVNETRLSVQELEDLRKEAEQHLDEAQSALFDDSISDEDAAIALNKALRCLDQMIEEPEEVVVNFPTS